MSSENKESVNDWFLKTLMVANDNERWSRQNLTRQSTTQSLHWRWWLQMLKINNDFKMKVDQVVESPPPGVDFDACKEEEEGLCCLGYVSQWGWWRYFDDYTIHHEYNDNDDDDDAGDGIEEGGCADDWDRWEKWKMRPLVPCLSVSAGRSRLSLLLLTPLYSCCCCILYRHPYHLQVCHTSYITQFTSRQEEQCLQQYRKQCNIIIGDVCDDDNDDDFFHNLCIRCGWE